MNSQGLWECPYSQTSSSTFKKFLSKRSLRESTFLVGCIFRIIEFREQKPRQEIIDSIKQQLQDIENAKGKENKKQMCTELMEYLSRGDVVWFIDSHKRFKETLDTKFMEFIEWEGMDNFVEYYKKIFKTDYIYKHKLIIDGNAVLVLNVGMHYSEYQLQNMFTAKFGTVAKFWIHYTNEVRRGRATIIFDTKKAADDAIALKEFGEFTIVPIS